MQEKLDVRQTQESFKVHSLHLKLNNNELKKSDPLPCNSNSSCQGHHFEQYFMRMLVVMQPQKCEGLLIVTVSATK